MRSSVRLTVRLTAGLGALLVGIRSSMESMHLLLLCSLRRVFTWGQKSKERGLQATNGHVQLECGYDRSAVGHWAVGWLFEKSDTVSKYGA